MKIGNVFSTLEKFAPISISNELVKAFNGYDNSGIIASVEDEIKGVIFTLDLTEKSVETAIENGANLIVTHHPAIYAPIKTVDGALLKCIQNKIGVISMHLNLDACNDGIDYHLANGLGGVEQKIVTELSSGCGYGRVFEFNESFNSLKKRYQEVFNTDKVMAFGNLDKKIKKVASFCGSGLDINEVDGLSYVDAFVSADIKHHVILYALERGKCVLQVSHYSSEVYGFRKFYNEIKSQLSGLNCVFFENQDMI